MKDVSKGLFGMLAVLACYMAPGTARAADPCRLLTQQQVSAAAGVSVSPGSPIATTGCDWAGPAGSKVRVTISLWPASGWDQMKMPPPGSSKTSVPGLGDDAVQIVIGPFTSLSVKKGNTVFMLRVYGVPDTQKQAGIEKTLAADAVTQL